MRQVGLPQATVSALAMTGLPLIPMAIDVWPSLVASGVIVADVQVALSQAATFKRSFVRSLYEMMGLPLAPMAIDV